MSLASIAHLPPERRTVGLVHWVAGKKRSMTGWLVLIGFVALNEARGIYMIAEFLKAMQA